MAKQYPIPAATLSSPLVPLRFPARKKSCKEEILIEKYIITYQLTPTIHDLEYIK